MRNLILAGVAACATFVAYPRPAAAYIEHAWCGVENGRSRACDYDTREQCRLTRERLGGGDCFENPNYHGHAATSATKEGRVRTHRRHVARLKTQHD